MTTTEVWTADDEAELRRLLEQRARQAAPELDLEAVLSGARPVRLVAPQPRRGRRRVIATIGVAAVLLGVVVVARSGPADGPSIAASGPAEPTPTVAAPGALTELRIFLDPGATLQEVALVQQFLAADERVVDLEFRNQRQAYAEFLGIIERDAVAEVVRWEDMPSSFAVTVSGDVRTLRDELGRMPLVREVVFERDRQREPAELGRPIGHLSIPAIRIDKFVVEGVDPDSLRIGPGHDPSTVLPGEDGNAVIFGHRTIYGAPFMELDELKPGDEIRVRVGTVRLVFEVRAQARALGHYIVEQGDRSPWAPTDDAVLTLVSHHPEHSAAERIVVVADLVSSDE